MNKSQIRIFIRGRFFIPNWPRPLSRDESYITESKYYNSNFVKIIYL